MNSLNTKYNNRLRNRILWSGQTKVGHHFETTEFNKTRHIKNRKIYLNEQLI